MAGRRQQQKHAAAHRLFAPPAAFAEGAGHDDDEFDEFDVWGCGVEPRQPEFPKPGPSSSRPAARSKGGDRSTAAGSSLPVNIPDWPKILGNYYGGSHSSTRGWWEEEDEGNGGEEGGAGAPMIPPHELLCRSRAASFSVQEGAGRTLKGRDLRRVRNAIWEKTGFQD
ncbi:hypothetical protein Cni_G18366 [Canna indica]|uniref:Senescence regulator n=1 Tax=Canna indica TaxID=4628 RepID=A0AAQ3QHL8_9LILI|nr:hypothetical protein Cni_G18366 [Canna indica]